MVGQNNDRFDKDNVLDDGINFLTEEKEQEVGGFLHDTMNFFKWTIVAVVVAKGMEGYYELSFKPTHPVLAREGEQFVGQLHDASKEAMKYPEGL